jgi:hypothetical protein
VRRSTPSALDTGIYAHQVRVNPSNKTVFLVTRGNGPTKTKPEDRGAVKIFSYADGMLMNLASIAPNGGVNFQPRHLDFHPTQPWVFLSLERQTQLQVYHLTKDGSLDALPLFTKDSVANPAQKARLQNSGTLHVHRTASSCIRPRARQAQTRTKKRFWAEPEQHCGVGDQSADHEPTLLQNADTHGAEPEHLRSTPALRCWWWGIRPLSREVSQLSRIPRSGRRKLDFVRKYDVDTSGGSLFWMGIVPLP